MLLHFMEHHKEDTLPPTVGFLPPSSFLFPGVRAEGMTLSLQFFWTSHPIVCREQAEPEGKIVLNDWLDI